MLVFKSFLRNTPSLTQRLFHLSSPTFARVTEMVPALGESITEGTISKWVKSVGDSVEIDDAIVIVETDKVSVEIKSHTRGILAKQIPTDSVKVGAPLFEIETDSTIKPTSSVQTHTTPNPVSSNHIETKGKKHHRIPLIKFIGKRIKQKRENIPKHTHSHQNSFNELKKPIEGNGIDFSTLPGKAWFGRPRLYDPEMEAIESGGASLFNPPTSSKSSKKK